MMTFFNRTWLERVGVAGLDWNCRWASLQALDMALLCKDKKEERADRGSPLAAPMPKSVSF